MKPHHDPRDTFREEARELLTVLEQSLLGLEDDPHDQELIDAVFRSLHTIKGSGDMFGFDRLVACAHTVESVFVRVRDGSLAVDAELVSLGLRAKDHIATLLDGVDDGTVGNDAAVSLVGAELDAACRRYLPAHEGPTSAVPDRPGSAGAGAPEPAPGVMPDSANAAPQRTWRVLFRPNRDLFRNGTNPLLLIDELSQLGTVLTLGFSDGIPALSELDPEGCYVSWELLVTTAADENAIRDVFIFVEGEADITVTLIDTVDDADLSYKRLGEILLERGDVTPDALSSAVNERSFLGQTLIEKGYVSGERVRAALQEQRYVRSLRETRREADGDSVIRVKTKRLDELVNLVGEFVSMHANLNFLAAQKQDQDFVAVGEQMERLIRGLRDLSIELHMVPVEILFSGFRRLVRDLSSELGKEVVLRIEGAETELDKNVIDLLKDPLLHIIRNSIDHGIETPEARARAGKPVAGEVKLSAGYAGSHVVIRVRDDGAGLDVGRIRGKAVAAGLLPEDRDYSEDEIVQCIFAAGFSTAETTTSVSGRGVGMNVVQRNVEQLGGSIAVKTWAGAGSEIVVRIPLTLAIVDGLLATVDRNYYLINLSYIVECLDLSAVHREPGRDFINFRGGIVPFVDLRAFFRLPATDAPDRQLVIVSVDGRSMGLVVDAIHDTYQSVIKSLGRVYEKLEGISGAIMLGNGTPALVLDVDRLVRISRKDVNR